MEWDRMFSWMRSRKRGDNVATSVEGSNVESVDTEECRSRSMSAKIYRAESQRIRYAGFLEPRQMQVTTSVDPKGSS